MTSPLEGMLGIQLRALKVPQPEREFRFCERRWRFDFAWPDRKLAVEVEGGLWTGGRHVRADGYAKDCDKHNAAVMQGWRLLRFTREHIRSGKAVAMIQEALRTT